MDIGTRVLIRLPPDDIYNGRKGFIESIDPAHNGEKAHDVCNVKIDNITARANVLRRNLREIF